MSARCGCPPHLAPLLATNGDSDMTPRSPKTTPLLLCAVLALICGQTRAAPAPLPRPPAVTAVELRGIWRVTWAGKDYLSYFQPDGQVEFYDYEVPSLWVGRWRVERGVLHIEGSAWRKGLPGGMPRKW